MIPIPSLWGRSLFMKKTQEWVTESFESLVSELRIIGHRYSPIKLKKLEYICKIHIQQW